MKNLFAVVLLLLSLHTLAQNTTYKISKDPRRLIYNGLITLSDLDMEPTFNWMKTGANEYAPDARSMDYLRHNLGNYSMVVFLGTWCSDSQDLIPKFEKVLQVVNYPPSSLTMYGVDRSKKTKKREDKTYKIAFVPTIILIRNGKETGRITESVDKSVEEDLAAIIEKDRAATQKQ